MSSKCPCGSNRSYESCCGPFIDGTHYPKTPEELMRSRYTAYSKALIDYIMKTMQGEASLGYQPDSSRAWAQKVEWLGLEVLHATPVENEKGWVEFIAHYKEDGKLHHIHEISEFQRVDGKWYYVRGKLKGEPKPYSPKVSRNDPCVCGSGKKFKQCCGK